jgi:hypothetical protein
MIVQSFYSHLSNASGVLAITSSIYPHHLPQHASKPAITYGMAGDDDEQLVDGDISSLKTALFDVDCWDYSYLDAHRLADAVETAVVGHTGDLGSLSPADQVDHIRKERRFDLFESDTKLYRVSLQFLVAYF